MLGTVGEPINPEAWLWYHRVVGDSRCAVVDTFWQTETGGHVITPLPGATPTKPGSACRPFFGVQPALMDEQGAEIHGARRGLPGVPATLARHHADCVRKPSEVRDDLLQEVQRVLLHGGWREERRGRLHLGDGQD